MHTICERLLEPNPIFHANFTNDKTAQNPQNYQRNGKQTKPKIQAKFSILQVKHKYTTHPTRSFKE